MTAPASYPTRIAAFSQSAIASSCDPLTSRALIQTPTGIDGCLSDSVRVWTEVGLVERRDAVAGQRDGVDLLQVFFREADAHRAEIVLELLHRPGSDDRRCHA